MFVHSLGHWIHQCPTNGDPNYDFHKVKKPTGIPRSFLKPVQGGDAKATLLLPEGGFAIMIPNEEVFLKEIEKMKVESDGTFSIPESLKCTLCNGLLNDAVLIPCCGYSFCDECMFFFIILHFSFFSFHPFRFFQQSVCPFSYTHTRR